MGDTVEICSFVELRPNIVGSVGLELEMVLGKEFRFLGVCNSNISPI